MMISLSVGVFGVLDWACLYQRAGQEAIKI
jgi:hypothetical protein